MFIVVFWGSYTTKRKLGIVADVCPQCGSIERFQITRYHRVDHIQGIPTGAGQSLGAGRRCEKCGSEFHCNTADFTVFVPPGQARSMSLEALIAETNEELNAQSPEVQQFRQRLTAAMRSYPDLAAAVAAIDELPVGQVTKKKLKQEALGQWAKLSQQGRAKLMQPVHNQLARQQRRAEAVEFVRNVLGFAPRPATGLFVTLFIAIWPIGCISGAFLHEHISACSACFIPIGMLVALLLFWSWRTRRISRAWFQRYIIDRAKRDNMPIADVVWAVRELECRPPGEPNARNLLKYAGMLERMVRRQFPEVKLGRDAEEREHLPAVRRHPLAFGVAFLLANVFRKPASCSFSRSFSFSACT
jgi:hypothetical protein